MKHLLTTYEAAKKFCISSAYVRKLAAAQRIINRKAEIKKGTYIYLINAASIKKFLKTKRKPGRPPKD